MLETQLVRVRNVRDTLEALQRSAATLGEDLVWRSRAAGGFHREAEEVVAVMQSLTTALHELERSIRSSRARLLHPTVFVG